MFQLPSLFKIRAVALVAGFFLLFWLIGFVKWCFAAPYQCYSRFNDWQSVSVGYSVTVWDGLNFNSDTNYMDATTGTVAANVPFMTPLPSGQYKTIPRLLYGWNGTQWVTITGSTTQRHYSVAAISYLETLTPITHIGLDPIDEYPTGCPAPDPCPDRDNDDIEDKFDPFPDDGGPFTWGIDGPFLSAGTGGSIAYNDGYTYYYSFRSASGQTANIAHTYLMAPVSAGQLVYDENDWKAITGTCSNKNQSAPEIDYTPVTPPVDPLPPVEEPPPLDPPENDNDTNQLDTEYLKNIVANTAGMNNRQDETNAKLQNLYDAQKASIKTQNAVGSAIVGSVKNLGTKIDLTNNTLSSINDGISGINTSLGNLDTNLGSLIDSLGQLNDKLNGTYVPENISNDYVNTSVENVSEFTGRLNTLISDLRSSPLFSLPNQVLGNIPSGGTPVYTVSMGQYGSADIDLAEYDGVFAIVRAVLLVCFSFASLRIVVSHR